MTDEDIPPKMPMNLIAKGFKPEIAEKILDQETIDDLFRISKRAESTWKITKSDKSVVPTLEGMDDRLLSKLTAQLE